MLYTTPEEWPDDPHQLFEDWMAAAEQTEINDANAMCLATVGADQMPSTRIVLLKSHNPSGFVFFTNTESRKGEQLRQNQKAALNFHWKSLRRQIRIEGEVSFVSSEEADAYFQTRPRESRIGAWASRQSRPLPVREEFDQRYKSYEQQFKAQDYIPRPPHWTGYRVAPLRMEFWIQEDFRLHQRCLYEPIPGHPWQKTMLYP
ncbi:MAG: pyridoxamine 5'-phosphate oxidase [Rhodospirillales bacterium]|nr:pyridoxamine 5'-phosphate oxidase [Rhodospirillales bacterium]